MRGPDGNEMPNLGVYLEVVKNERLSWTNALEVRQNQKQRAVVVQWQNDASQASDTK